MEAAAGDNPRQQNKGTRAPWALRHTLWDEPCTMEANCEVQVRIGFLCGAHYQGELCYEESLLHPPWHH
jgi:hypothetical protein